MRIAVVSLHFAEYAFRLAAALAEDHSVLLIASQPNFELELDGQDPAPRPDRLEVVLLPHRPSPRLFVQNALSIVREIGRFAPDVVHVEEDPKEYLAAACLPLRRRFPVVLTVHDPRPHAGYDERASRSLRKRWCRAVMRKSARAIIVHGETLRSELVDIAPELAGAVHVAPHGLLGPALTEQAPERGHFLLFGRLHEYKGLAYFLRSCLALVERGHAITGIVAGRGTELAKHRSTLLGHDCFELHEGHVPRRDAGRLFARAQAVVLPYTEASQSGVAAFALGCGRPVIASRVGAIPDLVEDGVNGLLVPPADVDALSAALERFFREPDLVDALTRRARLQAENPQASWRAAAARTLDVYRHAITSRPGLSRAVPARTPPAP